MLRLNQEVAEGALTVRVRLTAAHRLEEELPREARAALRLQNRALTIRYLICS